MRTREIASAGSALALVFLALLACKKKEDGATSTTTGATGTNAQQQQQQQEAPPGEPPPSGKPGKGCVLPDSIDADWTITKGCKTQLKRGLYVNNEATLTIEEGARVEASTDTFLWINKGKLVVKGTQKEPVVFTSANVSKAPGDWVGIGFQQETMAGTVIDHALIEYAGSKNASGEGALKLDNMRQGGRISVTNTEIKDSGQFCVVSDDNGAFGKFEGNTLTGCKDGSLHMEAQTLGSISKNNKVTDPIRVRQSTVSESATWPDLGVPFVLESNVDVGSSTSVAVLTIPDKAVVKVGTGLYFSVGTANAGALVASGVTFTSSSPSPAPGDWVGIFIGNKSSGTSIQNCTFDYAGSEAASGNGAITFFIDAKSARGVKIENNTFRNLQKGAFGSPDGDCQGFPKTNKVEGASLACSK